MRLPLFVITGTSGTGKTRLCLEMAARDRQCIHLETDILWGSIAASPEDDYRSYREAWLRVAKNIGQGGRPAALYGSTVPDQIEPCAERRYFQTVHYLALVCQADVLVERLKARPGWRSSGDEPFIRSMLEFNGWFLENAAASQPAIRLLDTSDLSPGEMAARTQDWMQQSWPGEAPE